MKAKAYLENNKYDLYDENGNLVMAGFKSMTQLENWCIRNNYKVTELFEVILTQKIKSDEPVLEEAYF
jgi:hypothetical protein